MAKRFIVWCTLGIVAVFLFSPAHDVAGQGRRETWSLPLIIDDGWWQSITTDVQGTAYLGWYGSTTDEKGEHDVLKYSYLPVGGEWETPADVVYTGDGGYTVRNAIATTSDGRIFAALRYGTHHVVTSSYVEGSLNAANWAVPKVIDNIGYYINMTSDRHNILHLAYDTIVGAQPPAGGGNSEASICAYCHDLYYRRSTDEGKTWSDPVPISTLPDTGSDRMEFEEGQSGRLYLDWDEGQDWYVGKGVAKDGRIIYSDDDGLTWSDPIILDGGGLVDRRPIQLAVTEMRDKSLMAVWRYSTDADRHIYYQISSDSGATWTVPAPIDGMTARSINETPLDDYELITDKLGIVHLFAVALTNGANPAGGTNSTLYHVTYQQGVWTSPYPVFYSRDYWPEWPKAAIGINNDIHLSWFSRGIPEGQAVKSYTDVLKVFYSHLPGTFDISATATFSPTETPVPTEVIQQEFEPTLTPIPTFASYNANFTTQTQDNLAAFSLLGGVFASGLFCVGVILVLRFWRGRQ